MNLTRAPSATVLQQRLSKLETEGKAAGINNCLQGAGLHTKVKKWNSWGETWYQGKRLFQEGIYHSMFDDGKDPAKRKNNPAEEGENCRSNVPEQMRGKCSDSTGLRRACGPLKCSGGTTGCAGEANSCRQGDLVFRTCGWPLPMVPNSYVPH